MNEEKLLIARSLLAGYLKSRREELGMTQAELAEKLGWQQSTVARAESEKYFLNSKQLWMLCNALDLYFFLEPKEKDSDLVRIMKYRFSDGKPPSKN